MALGALGPSHFAHSAVALTSNSLPHAGPLTLQAWGARPSRREEGNCSPQAMPGQSWRLWGGRPIAPPG